MKNTGKKQGKRLKKDRENRMQEELKIIIICQ